MRLLLICAALAGCATTTDPAFLQAQLDAQRMAMESQKPLVRLTAQPGQPITGLAGVEVFMPAQPAQIQQSRPNEWAGVASQAIGVLGTVGGIYYGAKAAVGLANAVGANNAAIAGQIQAPGAVTTTSTTTSTSNTLSGTGTLGGGSFSAPTTTTTTSNTATPTVVTQPAPLVVTQPAPVIVP